MPTYKYVAVNLHKRKFKGIYIAEDEKDLAVQLAKQNLYLVSAKVYKGGTPSAFFTLGTGKVKLTELTSFCRQFSILITSGIPILGCLEGLKQQSYSSYFKSILQVVCEDVKGGAMLSDALEKHSKVFPNFFRSMIRVGEVSGKLDTVFLSLADYYEADSAIKRKARSALSYPSMLALMTLGIVILMLAFVIPTFREALSSLEIEPEGLTKTVYEISEFLLNYWQFLLVGVILFGLALFAFLQTKTGKKAFDVFKIKAPFIGRVSVNLITARFARALSILLSSGMTLDEALDTISLILGNSYVEERFNEASEDIRHGVSLTDAFQKQNLFPPMLIQMISVGEKTASIEEVLTRSCRFFDEQVETSLTTLTSNIQPVMLILMGVVVGTLFIAIYSPMLSIMNGLG